MEQRTHRLQGTVTSVLWSIDNPTAAQGGAGPRQRGHHREARRPENPRFDADAGGSAGLATGGHVATR